MKPKMSTRPSARTSETGWVDFVRQGASVGRSSKIYWVIALLGIAHGVLYAILLPPWSIQDEQQHFDYAERIAKDHGPPVVAKTHLLPEVAQSVFDSKRWQKFGWPVRSSPDPATWGLEGYSYEAHQPPLYYAALSVPLRFMPGSVNDRLFASRLFMVLLSLVAVLCLALTVLAIWPTRHDLALLACLFLVLMPGRVEPITRVNNDGLAEALGAAVVLLATRCAMSGINMRRALLLGVLFSLAMLTKMTCLALLTPIIAAFYFNRTSPRIVSLSLFTALSIATLTVPVFLYAWSRSDFFAMESVWPGMRNYDPHDLGIKGLVQSVVMLFQGFWFFQDFWIFWRYQGLARSIFASAVLLPVGLISLASVVSWVRVWVRESTTRTPPQNRKQAAWSAVLAFTFVGGATLLFVLLARGDIPYLHARYLLPYGTAALVFLVGGLSGRKGTSALAVLAMILFLVDIVWLVDGHVLRFYVRSSYAHEILAQLNGAQTGVSAHAQVLMSDKPEWAAPLVIGGVVAYVAGLLALPWQVRRRFGSSLVD